MAMVLNESTDRVRIKIMRPKSIAEASQCISAVREGITVVLGLGGMNPDEAQRIVDFVAGGVLALDGHRSRISEEVVLFAPILAQINLVSTETKEAA